MKSESSQACWQFALVIESLLVLENEWKTPKITQQIVLNKIENSLWIFLFFMYSNVLCYTSNGARGSLRYSENLLRWLLTSRPGRTTTRIVIKLFWIYYRYMLLVITRPIRIFSIFSLCKIKHLQYLIWSENRRYFSK